VPKELVLYQMKAGEKEKLRKKYRVLMKMPKPLVIP